MDALCAARQSIGSRRAVRFLLLLPYNIVGMYGTKPDRTRSYHRPAQDRGVCNRINEKGVLLVSSRLGFSTPLGGATTTTTSTDGCPFAADQLQHIIKRISIYTLPSSFEFATKLHHTIHFLRTAAGHPRKIVRTSETYCIEI